MPNALCGSKGCGVCAHLALVLLSLLVFRMARRHGSELPAESQETGGIFIQPASTLTSHASPSNGMSSQTAETKFAEVPRGVAKSSKRHCLTHDK